MLLLLICLCFLLLAFFKYEISFPCAFNFSFNNIAEITMLAISAHASKGNGTYSRIEAGMSGRIIFVCRRFS